MNFKDQRMLWYFLKQKCLQTIKHCICNKFARYVFYIIANNPLCIAQGFETEPYKPPCAFRCKFEADIILLIKSLYSIRFLHEMTRKCTMNDFNGVIWSALKIVFCIQVSILILVKLVTDLQWAQIAPLRRPYTVRG